jgi:hypothetical protein
MADKELSLNEQIEFQIEQVGASELVAALDAGADVYTALTENFIESFEFYGQTLKQWADELLVNIPDDMQPDAYRKLLAELANNVQKASNYHSVACSLADAIKGGRGVKRSDVVRAIVTGYQERGARRPSGTIIERMADSYMSSTVSGEVAAKLVQRFWRQRLDQLIEVRRILEMISMSLHVELKHTAGY